MRVKEPGYYYATSGKYKWITEFTALGKKKNSHVICIHDNIFIKNQKKTSLDYDRLATEDEIQWLEACKRAGEFVPKHLAMVQNIDDYSLTF